VSELLRAFQLRELSPGVPKVLTQANPAAGADLVLTVPGGKVWEVWAVNATLVTSAAAASRMPQLLVDDGATTALRIAASAFQVATQTTLYTWVADFGSAIGVANSSWSLPIPARLALGSGYRVRTSTLAIDAADQWSAITFFVVEYFDGITIESEFLQYAARAEAAGAISLQES
jgi:hypothetical protein